jgi:4-amino-4-deoxy-L-arabinose transferase-like glycosyltransferase
VIEIKSAISLKTAYSVLRPFLCLAALLLAFVTYFYGLDGLHIPKNGDEYPYIHITRLTAASGKLLPLQSQVDHIRNTKPPLLFWQGIATTQWGKNWTLWSLRYPSVIYTILTAMLTLLIARKLSGQIETGVMAALTFLAFFSTYRYGRPFLTDPGLVFWLQLPFFTLLYWRPASFDSRFAVPLLVGLEVGIGLLYKSFALVVPICLTMSWWYLFHRDYCLRTFLTLDIWKIALSVLLALSIFGLWFLFDPNPMAVWKEFVLGENFGKFDPHISGYLQKLLWGSSSIWSLALLFLANAGLLIFPLAALFVLAFVTRRKTSPEKTLLWLWVIVLFVVFSIPSQRSGRYLMPAIPMLSVLLVLDWERISRKLFMVTLTCCGLLLLVILYLTLRLNWHLNVSLHEWPYWLLIAFTCGLIITGLLVPGTTRVLSLVATLLIYVIFSASMRPLDVDGPLGSFSKGAQRELKGRQVWVPINWTAHDEPYHFLLPGADVHGYDLDLKLNTHQLAERYMLFAKRVPITENPAGAVLSECPDCRIIGERLDLGSRQNPKELREMLLEGKLFELLFVRELLIESPRSASGYKDF